MSAEEVPLRKDGLPRKRAPGAGRRPTGTVRITGYVLPATAALLSQMREEKGCTVGVALDLLLLPKIFERAAEQLPAGK